MRVLVLGGDGYLGWPTAIHLSAHGCDVTVADNYLRRRLSQNEDVEPLHPVPNLHERVAIWKSVSGKQLDLHIGDLTEWDFVSRLFAECKPDAIVHYAEQPSAPFSMLNREASTLTLHNNLLVTANVIYATREFCPGAHIVKLGTMGEYGTPDIDIEEGWLDVAHKGRTDRFLYPRQAGSLYHTTKIMDTDLLWYYVRVWKLRVTDLMQGPVYGLITDENRADEKLMPFFSYDELFGTVLNRFVVQAVAEHPLTVYGKGGQTRGYLNIRDTLNCVRLALENPPETGELRIFNQFTETFSVLDLARMVQSAGKRFGLNVQLQNVENPRIEQEEHYYNPAHTGLVELGLEPHLLTEEVLLEMMDYVNRHSGTIRIDRFYQGTTWA